MNIENYDHTPQSANAIGAVLATAIPGILSIGGRIIGNKADTAYNQQQMQIMQLQQQQKAQQAKQIQTVLLIAGTILLAYLYLKR
jgi:predicted NAD-dependent protein-ADP-ribosyltransferase YbiA (DUF1768 family)